MRTVTKSHQASYERPIHLERGESLKCYEERESPWPGWLWCEAQSGLVGWVPTSYLKIEDGIAKALCDYSANELTVSVGVRLSVEKEESGWLWCTMGDGQQGWIPKENVELKG